MQANNLQTTLRVADAHLSQWSTRTANYYDSQALNAERRALRRAHRAIDAAMTRAEVNVGNAIDRFQEQVAVASLAAYPPRRVADDNQAEMETLARGGAFLPHRTTTRSSGERTQRAVVVPLSGIPAAGPSITATGGTSVSDASSASWITTSNSDASSEFEVIERVNMV
jgi:hypothetical protein